MNNKQRTNTQQELMSIFVDFDKEDSYKKDIYILGCYANFSLLSFVILKVNASKNEFVIMNQGILKANNIKEYSKEIMILFDKYKIRNVISNDIAEVINSGGYINEYKIDGVKQFIRWQSIEIANPEKSIKLILSLFLEKKLKLIDDNTMKEWKEEFDSFNIEDCLEGLKDYPLIFALCHAMQFRLCQHHLPANTTSYRNRY